MWCYVPQALDLHRLRGMPTGWIYCKFLQTEIISLTVYTDYYHHDFKTGLADLPEHGYNRSDRMFWTLKHYRNGRSIWTYCWLKFVATLDTPDILQFVRYCSIVFVSKRNYYFEICFDKTMFTNPSTNQYGLCCRNKD